MTFKRLRAIAIVPLSILPFAIAVPGIASSHDRYQREHASDPFAAPPAKLSVRERAAMPAFETGTGGIPVLVWHGIGPADDGYTVTQQAFAKQLVLLRSLGFESISSEQYAAWRAHKPVALPAKPILLTFDDGRLDSYRGADKVLQRYGMRATIFAITEEIEDGNPFYLTWEELHAMRDSGRWDIQPHAHAGHRTLATNVQGDHAPFYTARRYTTSGGVETLAQWEARVSEDLFTVKHRFLDHGIEPEAFAVPYGDYGQRSTNDPSIPGLLSGLLTRQFGNWFIQADDNDPSFTGPGTGAAQRFELTTDARLDDLYGWLRRHSTDEK